MGRLSARIRLAERAAAERFPGRTPEDIAAERSMAALRRVMSYPPLYAALLDLEALNDDPGFTIGEGSIWAWARSNPKGRAILARLLWHDRALRQIERRQRPEVAPCAA